MNPINSNFSAPIFPNQPRVIEGISIQPLTPNAAVDKSIPANFVNYPNILITNIVAINKKATYN